MNEVQLTGIRNMLQLKLADMTAQEAQGGAPPGAAPADPAAAGAMPPGAMPPGAAPPGAAPPGAMPPGAMPPGGDPAAMAAAAGGDPLGGMGGPQQAPPSLEEAAKAGDPLASALLAINAKLDLVIETIATLMDNTGAQVPASQSIASQAKQIDEASKAAAAPGVVIQNNSLGVPANPGSNGARRLDTGMSPTTGNRRMDAVAQHWKRHR